MEVELSSNDGYLGLLSDEVLLMILQNLTSLDLFNVLKTCRRLYSIGQEEMLWTSIETKPDKSDKIRFAIYRLLNPKTKSVKLSSHIHPTNKGYRTSLPPSLCSHLMQTGENLTELRLNHQLLDGKYFNLLDLPKFLKVLDMTGSVVTNLAEHVSFFKDMCLRFRELETLELSHCPWVTAHSLMAISKLPSLQNLKLKGCRAIGECLAYVALSSRFGFHKLKILDVTDTRVGSTEFTAFAGIATLEEFYFGQYDTYVDHNCNYIKDLCLTRIRNNKKLRILDMSGSRITDRSMDILLTIPSLVRVDANFTHLTENAIESFHSSRPNCRIYKAPLIPGDVIPPPPSQQEHFEIVGGDLEMLPGIGIVVGHAGGQMGHYINLVINYQHNDNVNPNNPNPQNPDDHHQV